MWDKVGMSRNEASLKEALKEVRDLREQFWRDVKVVGAAEDLNKNLEHALRVADYMEFGELLILDALHRTESCGGHFREESQTEEGEAKRDDEQFAYVAAWEYSGTDKKPVMHVEPLSFDFVEVKQRSYK
jgi:succinate dehydrogenase / fumarate reductase flavoprotein subunit